MATSEFDIAINNYAGVPVVELAGEINKRALAALNETLDKLARAGHYNVMINIKRTAWQSLSSLASLKKAAKTFQTHYGRLDLVAEAEQISRLLRPLGNIVRFCSSEVDALRRIKRLPALSVGAVRPTPAHLI